MGRRRWKQYQDTLYSGTRSSESVTAQPHHRLYPAFSSSCDPVPGNLEQIGPRALHPASTSLPTTITTTTSTASAATAAAAAAATAAAAAAVAAITTASTISTAAATTATTASTTSLVKQESLQRHTLQNHHHLQPSVPDHHRHYQQQPEDQRRLRPDEVKVEIGEDEFPNGVAREEPATKATEASTATTVTTATTAAATAATTGTSTATSSTNSTGTVPTIAPANAAATMTTGTTTIPTRRRRKRRQNDGDGATDDREDDEDNEEEEDARCQNEAEKRLKLDQDADRPASPLRREKDRATRDYPTANATDTEGTKVRQRFSSYLYPFRRARPLRVARETPRETGPDRG